MAVGFRLMASSEAGGNVGVDDLDVEPHGTFETKWTVYISPSSCNGSSKHTMAAEHVESMPMIRASRLRSCGVVYDLARTQNRYQSE